MHLWRAVTIITVSVQKEVGDMDQSALQEFFYGEGYRSFSAGPEEITVYYRYVSGDVHAVIMIDMQNGYRISRGNHEILEEYVKNIFFDSGNASTYFSEGQLSGGHSDNSGWYEGGKRGISRALFSVSAYVGLYTA